MSIRRALAILTLALVVTFGGLVLTRHMIAVAGEMDAERLNRSILEYIAQKNPRAPISAFQRFPEVMLAEAQRTNLDHCLVLAQAEVESEFKHDAVGDGRRDRTLPDPALHRRAARVDRGKFKKPVLTTTTRDLGDLAEPADQRALRDGVSARHHDAQAERSRTRSPSTTAAPPAVIRTTTAWSWAPTSRCWSGRSSAAVSAKRPSRCRCWFGSPDFKTRRGLRPPSDGRRGPHGPRSPCLPRDSRIARAKPALEVPVHRLVSVSAAV